jgi:hypothetical protein
MTITTPLHQPSTDLGFETKLQLIKSEAVRLLQPGIPITDRLPRLRATTRELGLSLRDSELLRYLKDARREATGVPELITSADTLDLSTPEWIWEGVLMAGSLNLLLALPKVGKTTLLMALVGALHRKETSFLGLPLAERCPPVLIIGTDQPERDWGRNLLDSRLIWRDDKGNARLCDPPIIGLAHAGCPWHLDEEGIQRIAQEADKHPGLLIVLDSLHACTRVLGLNENSAELANPVIDLMEAVGPYDATVVVIHHAGKGKAGTSASEFSRGSTALPAAASQIITLKALQPEAGSGGSRRLLLEAEGRAARPVELVIERQPDGSWISSGDYTTVVAAQKRQELQDALPQRAKDLQNSIRELADHSAEWVSAADLAEHLAIHDEPGKRVLRRDLERLVKCGLLEADPESCAPGKAKLYRPVQNPEDETAAVDTNPPPAAVTAEEQLPTPTENVVPLTVQV